MRAQNLVVCVCVCVVGCDRQFSTSSAKVSTRHRCPACRSAPLPFYLFVVGPRVEIVGRGAVHVFGDPLDQMTGGFTASTGFRWLLLLGQLLHILGRDEQRSHHFARRCVDLGKFERCRLVREFLQVRRMHEQRSHAFDIVFWLFRRRRHGNDWLEEWKTNGPFLKDCAETDVVSAVMASTLSVFAFSCLFFVLHSSLGKAKTTSE